MSQQSSPEQHKVTVSFRKSADYKIFSATDIWGGPTADGGFVFFNLTIDHFPTPSYQSFEPDQENRINPNNPKETISSGDLEKELLCGMMLTPEVAIKIGTWLKNQGENLINLRGK